MLRSVPERLALGILLMVALAACGGEAQTEPDSSTGLGGRNAEGYTDISVSEFEQVLASEDIPIVNVHIPYEGEIAGTDFNIPFDDLAAFESALPEKDRPIAIYCRSGNMSSEMAAQLAERGYTDILELDGGYNAWVDAGGELTRR